MALILVVDDCIDNLICMEEFLSRLNCACRLASSGQMALELLDEEHFDLILSDYEMDGGDGLWLLQELKKIPHSPKCIIVTGNKEYSPKFFMQQGAAGHFFKPLQFHELQYMISKFVR